MSSWEHTQLSTRRDYHLSKRVQVHCIVIICVVDTGPPVKGFQDQCQVDVVTKQGIFSHCFYYEKVPKFRICYKYIKHCSMYCFDLTLCMCAWRKLCVLIDSALSTIYGILVLQHIVIHSPSCYPFLIFTPTTFSCDKHILYFLSGSSHLYDLTGWHVLVATLHRGQCSVAVRPARKIWWIILCQYIVC